MFNYKIMLKLYKYIFYSVYNKYLEWGENDVPSIYAIGVMILLQAFFIIGAVNIFCILLTLNWKFEKSHGIYLFLTLCIFNHIPIYKNPGKYEILKFWSGQTKSVKQTMTIFMVLHILLSFGLLVVSIVLRNYWYGDMDWIWKCIYRLSCLISCINGA